MSKFFFCDVETSGLDPKKNGILQLSAIARVPGKPDEKFSIRLQPFKTDAVEKEALEANKLNPEEGELPAVGHIELMKFLSRFVDKYNKRDKFFFVGYNASFDNQFLREFFVKCGDKYFGSWFWNPPLDLMSLALGNLLEIRPAMENFKLATVCKAKGIEFDLEKGHGAEYDVQKTVELWDKMVVL